MEDLVCIIHDSEKANSCVVFKIDEDLNKNIIVYMSNKYGKTAKINSLHFISFIVALTLKKYTDDFHIAKYNLIAPGFYNWVENSLLTDVSREFVSKKLTPFKYISKGFKRHDMKLYDSVVVKIYDSAEHKKNFTAENNKASIYTTIYYYMDNVLDQYISIDNVESDKDCTIVERNKINEIIKNNIYDFVYNYDNLDLDKKVVQIDKGENINSVKFVCGTDSPSFYFFDSNCLLYPNGYVSFKI